MDLHRLLADEASRLADLHFRGGGGLLALDFTLTQLQRHHVGDRGGLFGVHEHVDHAVLQHLEFADRHAELLAGLGIFDRGVHQHAHRANGFGCMRRDGFVRHLLDELEAVIGRADECGWRILEGDFGGVQTVDGRIIARGDAFGLLVHDEDADALGIALAARGARGDDQGIGPWRAQHDGLLAADRVAAAIFLGRRREVRKIVAALRFGEGESDDGFARRDLVQPFLLLRVCAAVLEEAAADHNGRHIGLHHQRLAELFHQNHDVDRSAAKAAIGFRQRRRHQAQLRELLPVLDAVARLAARDLLEMLEGVVVGQIFLDRIAQERLLLGE